MPKHEAEQFVLPLKEGKPRYSYSAVENAKCGRKHYYNKIEVGPRDFTYNLAAGTILDTAFNSYYFENQHLVESHEQRKEYARAAVQLLLSDHPDWYLMPWSQKPGDVRSSPENYIAWLFDLKAIDLVCRPDRGPVEVQKRVELDLPDYSIVGYIDCLELDTMTVVDVKAVTGYSSITETGYALRAQVPLYRMMLSDALKVETKGRYELLLCRKSPKLSVVADYDIDFLQQKLIKDFDAHHKRLSSNQFEKNPDQCFVYNKLCPFFQKCWPELSALVQNQK